MCHEKMLFSDLQNTLDILDCGVVKIKFDGSMKRHILWANEGFYMLTGHGKEGYEREMDENAHKVLHPDDMGWVFKAFHEHVSTRVPLSIEYRVIHKDGHVVWLYVKSNFVGEEQGCPIFISAMLDVTDQKMLRESLEREGRRHTLINNFSDDILFEYNTETNTLSLFGGAQKVLGQTTIENFTSSLRAGSFVHHDDITSWRGLVETTLNCDGVKRTNHFRLRYADGQHQWCYAIYNSVSGEKVDDVMVLGKIVNVHDTILKIKDLEMKSTLDGMTGVYNRSAVECAIMQVLRSGASHALLVLDIDCFKNANDTFGHAWGDTIIMRIVEVLKASFRSKDIIGRVGGDEFVVLLQNVASAQYIVETLKRYYQALHSVRDEEHPEYHFSTSVGVALFPTHADNYTELFCAADKALYTAKKLCKGSFYIYEGAIPQG